jgi:hypothetical protein
MKNRALAAGLLGDIAIDRNNYQAALRYAERAAQAGEDVVRFNPADLGTWQYWVRGRDDVALRLFERGDISQAIAQGEGTLELAKDPRLPSSLLPMLEDSIFRLANAQAAFGRRADAEQTFVLGVKASQESASQFDKSNPMRRMTLARVPIRRAAIELSLGDAAQAYERATAAAAAVEAMDVGKTGFAPRMRDGILPLSLSFAVEAALRLGRCQDAEALARKRLDLPKNPFMNPMDDTATRQVQLAFALACLGRGDEARSLVAPAIKYYAGNAAAGANDTFFNADYATALMALALAQPADAAGQSERRRLLAAASTSLNRSSAEARQLERYRFLARRIAEAEAAL